MPRAVSEKVGEGPCPSCGERIVYRRSAGGMLTHKCDYCDSSGYAAPGGEAYQVRISRMTKRSVPVDAPPDPDPEPPRTPQATKRAKVPNSAFDLADL